MKRHVRVYIEGGAEGRVGDNDFRRCWKKFLNELHDLARATGRYHSLEVVRGRGRGNAFRLFERHRNRHPNDLCVLLVDSEGAVPEGTKVWDVVAQRADDRWSQPRWAGESHLYLMVHSVETWLLTDQDALHRFFRHGFAPNVLPTTALEQRPKEEIFKALKRATINSNRGAYQHGHAHLIIEDVRPERVKGLSHGKRLFETLGKLIDPEKET